MSERAEQHEGGYDPQGHRPDARACAEGEGRRRNNCMVYTPRRWESV